MEKTFSGVSMKQALLIGCGNERGSKIVLGCKEADYSITNIGSSPSTVSDVNNIKIEWNSLGIETLHKILKQVDHSVDFLFFNQNSSSLAELDFTKTKDTLDNWRSIKGWGRSYWLSCQMPYFIIHTLGERLDSNSNIGWMLSGYIDVKRPGVTDHPDYSGYKFTNYLIMKNFNKRFRCFGINPEFQKNKDIKTLVKEICLGKIKCNGDFF